MKLFDSLTHYLIIRHTVDQMDEASLQSQDWEKSGMFTLKYCISKEIVE